MLQMPQMPGHATLRRRRPLRNRHVTESRLQRRLAAIAFADVVGYSRMMGADEAGTLAALTGIRARIVEPTVREHSGRIVKLMGDGVLMEFGSAVNAVAAAIELQDMMATAGADVSADRRIVLRIGINLGEVIVEGDDLYGDGVNIAARLESTAPPGGIVVSGSAYEQVAKRIAAGFEDLGELSLKNIAQPVRAWRVAAKSAIENAPAPAKKIAERPTIAILPFANLGEDHEQGYFSDGVTEDIITELSRWRLLSVSSRSASFRYRGVGVDLKQVARELNVRFIVEGSVRRMGGRIRITAQLIDTETGAHVWAEKYDRDAADIFMVQDEVVRTIVSTLVGRVQVSDVERARRKAPTSLVAYECVLKGNALPWDEPEGRAEAMRLFEKAIELDPDYGFAHAVLAAVWIDQWYDSQDDAGGALQKAYDLARRAVALDENESTCHSMLGHVCLVRHSFDLAMQYTRRAVELNPNNQWNTADIGCVMIYTGQAEEALKWFRRAREIDPYFGPPWYWRAAGQACMLLHRYEDALAMFEHLDVRHYRVSALAAACHARLGNTERARTAVAECLAEKPHFSIRHYLSKEPFKNPVEAEEFAKGLRLAGLPEGSNNAGATDRVASSEPAWVGDVLRFWFAELPESDWFAKHDDLDARIRGRFGPLHESLVAADGNVAATTRALLASVIVLDQFSRNMFRGSARAFAVDPIARRLARLAIERGFDVGMMNSERMFLYLPFEHSEDATDQAYSVQLFESLGNRNWTEYARKHQAIVDRFGRFPHRNAALGRESTAEEIEFLKSSGSGF